MAEGSIFHNGLPVVMKRSNTKYWNAATQEWETFNRAHYYNGSVWIPFIVGIPEPGESLHGGGGGRIPYTSQNHPVSSNATVNAFDIIRAFNYDPGATADSGGTVKLSSTRSSASDPTQNINFIFQLRTPQGEFIAQTPGYVSRGSEFTITFPRSALSNGLYFTWNEHQGSGFNTGWNPYLEDVFYLTF